MSAPSRLHQTVLALALLLALGACGGSDGASSRIVGPPFVGPPIFPTQRDGCPSPDDNGIANRAGPRAVDLKCRL
jgi:hypothetical protein